MSSGIKFDIGGRKGVSPLIAAVLLIAFTMAVAAILTAWVTTFTQDTAATVEEDAQQFIGCTHAQMSIYAVGYDSGANVLDVTVANTGTVDLGNVSVHAFDGAAIMDDGSGGQAIDFIQGLEAGAIDSISLDVSGHPDSVAVTSERCPDTTAEESQISEN